MQKIHKNAIFLIHDLVLFTKMCIFAQNFEKRHKITNKNSYTQMLKEKFYPNVKGWRASENDYVLLFMPDKHGMWRELGHEITKYNNVLLADYLNESGIIIPDYTQFLRIISDEYLFEYRVYDVNRVVIRYQKNVYK